MSIIITCGRQDNDALRFPWPLPFCSQGKTELQHEGQERLEEDWIHSFTSHKECEREGTDGRDEWSNSPFLPAFSTSFSPTIFPSSPSSPEVPTTPLAESGMCPVAPAAIVSSPPAEVTIRPRICSNQQKCSVR
eukprot:2642016-Rhodomonas_salina.1